MTGTPIPRMQPRRETRSLALLVSVLAAAVVSLTCASDAGGPDPNAVAVIVITPDGGNVDTGDSLQLAAVTRNAEGAALSGRPVTWTSLDTDTASVSATGMVHGVWPGTARVVALSDGKADTARVRVVARITGVVLTPPLDTLTALGDEAEVSVQAYIGARPFGGGSFTWTLSDTAVAWLGVGLDSTHRASVIARANGSTRVRVREARGATDSVAVVVRQRVARIDVLGPSVAYRGCPLRVVQAIAFDARDNVVTDAALTWMVTDTTVAVVDETGLITPRAVGTDTIVVRADTASARLPLTVQAAPPFALETYGARGQAVTTVGRGQYATGSGWLSGSLTAAPARFRVVSSDPTVLEPLPADTSVDPFASHAGPVRLVGRALGSVTLTPYTCDVVGPPTSVTVTPAHLAFYGTVPSNARTDQGPGFLYVETADATGATQYPAESLTVRLTATDPLVLRPDSAVRHLSPGMAELVTEIAWIGPGRARLVAADSAGVWVPDSSAEVEVVHPPLLFSTGDTLHLGMRQRGFPASVGVDRPVEGSPLRVHLSRTDTVALRVTPDSVDIPVGEFGAAIDVVGRDTIGTSVVTATAAGRNPGQSVIVVGRPRVLVAPLFELGLPHYPGDSPGQLVLNAVDSTTGFTRFPTEAVTFAVASSNPSVVSLDSTTLTVPAGQGEPHTATVSFNAPGTAVITATDPRSAFYAYAPGASVPITVVPRRLVADSLSLGVGQRWSFGVFVEAPIPSDIVAHLSHTTPAVAALSDTVATIMSSSRYGAVLARGLAAGVDSVVATASGWLPATGVVVVAPGQSRLVTWPATLGVGDSVSLYLEVLAPNGQPRHADVATEFTLAANANIAFVRNGVAITSVTVDPGSPSSDRFYVKGVAAGSGTVTASAAMYVPLHEVVTVTP